MFHRMAKLLSTVSMCACAFGAWSMFTLDETVFASIYAGASLSLFYMMIRGEGLEYAILHIFEQFHRNLQEEVEAEDAAEPEEPKDEMDELPRASEVLNFRRK